MRQRGAMMWCGGARRARLLCVTSVQRLRAGGPDQAVFAIIEKHGCAWVRSAAAVGRKYDTGKRLLVADAKLGMAQSAAMMPR